MTDGQFTPPPPPLANYGNEPSPAITFANVLPVVFKKYAVGRGRASRREFWFFGLWGLIYSVGGFILILMVGSVLGNSPIGNTVITLIFALWQLGHFALIILQITVLVRRLHDTGKSAHYLWFYLIPFIGAIVLLILAISPSDSGDNQYGPQPN
ncbi:MAG: hypothetical protein RL410_830 [Actinomycetota bacterium]|jgi:uncharacterized membrane protein YhaH (DUF805 family)